MQFPAPLWIIYGHKADRALETKAPILPAKNSRDTMRTEEWKPHEGWGERKTSHILCEHESQGDKSIPGSRGWAGTAQLCLRCDFWGLEGCPLLSSKSLMKDIDIISNHNHCPGARAQLPKEITAAALEWAELPNTPEIHRNPCSKRIKCIPVLANASLNIFPLGKSSGNRDYYGTRALGIREVQV